TTDESGAVLPVSPEPAWITDRKSRPVRVARVRGDPHASPLHDHDRAIRMAGFGHVLLLDPAAHVEPGFLAPLLDAVRGRAVLAATARVAVPSADGALVDQALCSATVRAGVVRIERWPVPDEGLAYALRVLFWNPAAALIDRTAYLALGGFEAAYRTSEIALMDLGYRAWRRGYRILLASESRVTVGPVTAVAACEPDAAAIAV